MVGVKFLDNASNAPIFLEHFHMMGPALVVVPAIFEFTSHFVVDGR